MTSRFYQTGHERATRVQQLFSTIANRYDLINDLQSFGLHRWWKRRLVNQAAVPRGGWVVDLCCGTGDVARALAHSDVRVLGIDFSLPMLQRARTRTAPPGQAGSPSNPPLAYLAADALSLPLVDDIADVVTISYGLRNLADLRESLSEMRRIVKPEGRLLVLDFGKPKHAAWRALYYAYLRLVVPVFGWLFFGDRETYRYILESLRHYPAQEGVAAALKETGWTGIRTTNFMGGIMSLSEGRNRPE